MARKTDNQTTPALPAADRAYNAGLDHGAVLGAQTKVVAQASVAHLKRGTGVTTQYSHGFVRGFLAGWKAA